MGSRLRDLIAKMPSVSLPVEAMRRARDTERKLVVPPSLYAQLSAVERARATPSKPIPTGEREYMGVPIRETTEEAMADVDTYTTEHLAYLTKLERAMACPPMFITYDEADKLDLDIKPGGVNRLEGVQWWTPWTKETDPMQFTISPAPNGGYIVSTPAYRMTTDTASGAPTFVGSLADCLEYIRSTFAAQDDAKTKVAADKEAQDAVRVQAEAIRADREKEIRALYANAGLDYQGDY